MMDPPDIFTARSLATYLGISYAIILRDLRQGKLPGQMIGGMWRIHYSDIREFLRGAPLHQHRACPGRPAATVEKVLHEVFAEEHEA